MTKYICKKCGWIGKDPQETNGHGRRCPLCFGLCEGYAVKYVIRAVAEKILSDGKSRASSKHLARLIRRKILERDIVSTHDLREITAKRVGTTLYYSPKFEQVAITSNGKTWSLKGGR